MHTLGDVVTVGLIIAALIVVPYKIVKAWVWPYVIAWHDDLLMAREDRRVTLMSHTSADIPAYDTNERERCSYAVEQPTEPLGSWAGTAFLRPWEQGEPPTDDEMLVWLALRMADDGTPYYAESRIAKFIGGRVEDRIAQVRAVRGVATPPKNVATKNYPHRTAEQEALRQQLRLGK